jgi:hypothetical protein
VLVAWFQVLPDLCRLANEIAGVFRSEIQPKIGNEGDRRRTCKVEIVEADAFADTCDWADSDVVVPFTQLPVHLSRSAAH